MPKHFILLTSGRPGPVLIDIPKDVQFSTFDYIPCAEVPLLKYIPEVHYEYDAALDTVVTLLRQAQQPVLYVGGGAIISEAHDQKFAPGKKSFDSGHHNIISTWRISRR